MPTASVGWATTCGCNGAQRTSYVPTRSSSPPIRGRHPAERGRRSYATRKRVSALPAWKIPARASAEGRISSAFRVVRAKRRESPQRAGTGSAISNLITTHGRGWTCKSRVSGFRFFFVLELPTADEEALGDEGPAQVEEDHDRYRVCCRLRAPRCNDLNAEIAVAALALDMPQRRRGAAMQRVGAKPWTCSKLRAGERSISC